MMAWVWSVARPHDLMACVTTTQVGACGPLRTVSSLTSRGSRVLTGRLHRYVYGDVMPAARLTEASPYNVVSVSPGCLTRAIAAPTCWDVDVVAGSPPVARVA